MDSLDNLLHQAEQQFKSGNEKKAAQLYQEILGLDPQNALAHAQLARCLNALHQTQQAETEARLALDLNPNLAQAHLALSYVYWTRRNCKEGEQVARSALQFDSHLTNAYIALSINLMEQARYDESIAILDQAHVLEPNNYLVYYNLGLAYLHSKSWDRAKENAWRAFRLHPSRQTLALIQHVVFSARPRLRRAIFLPWLILIFLSAQTNSIYFALVVNIIATIFIAIVFFPLLKPRQFIERLFYGALVSSYTLLMFVSIFQALNVKPDDVELKINKVAQQGGVFQFSQVFSFDAYSGEAKFLLINLRVKNKLTSGVSLKCYLRGALGHTYDAANASQSFPPGESLAELEVQVLSADRDLILHCGGRFYEFVVPVPSDY